MAWSQLLRWSELSRKAPADQDDAGSALTVDRNSGRRHFEWMFPLYRDGMGSGRGNGTATRTLTFCSLSLSLSLYKEIKPP